MKKALLFAGLLLALTASVAMAAGVSVSWKNFCWGEEGSSTDLTWACTTNINTNIRMTTSFKLDADMPDFVAAEIYMEGMVQDAVVPDWWELGDATTADCRNGTILSASADGTVLANGGGDICFDPWQGGGAGGIGLYSYDGNRMHLNAVWASATEIPLLANTEYFALQFRISGLRTVGTCPGCLVPAIWGLTKIGVCMPMATIYLDAPYLGGNQCLTWQSSTLPCAAPVPARNTTWGQVKSLYR
ncbi:MAG: hypothetical protein QUV05_19825 [Phycisphaerae bacterium]|nr:hypothetical protein [Phycisphaerae bacterium]